jgi:hypothetical protein
MVFLAITPAGLRQALEVAATNSASVWCGSDAITEAEYKALSAPDLSRFTYSLLDASANDLARAIDTIQEHHPDQTVWVERTAPKD